MTYRVLLGLDSLAALVVVYFFAVGLADGSVSAFNGELWAGLLLGVAAVIGRGPAVGSELELGTFRPRRRR